MRWFEGIVSLDGRLQGRERSDRRLLFIVAVAVFSLVMFSSMRTRLNYPLSLVSAGDAVFQISTAVIILQCVCRIHITKRMLKMYVVMWTVGICCVNLHNQASGFTPRWSLFVLVLDMSLVLRLGKRFGTCLVGCIVVWALAIHMDISFRFGLLELPGTTPDREDFSKINCSCPKPPCSRTVTWVLTETATVGLVLVIDFLATRGFAEEAQREQAAMARTIETVEAAAQLLAGYDVDTVAELLEAAEGRLPPAMYAALQRLEQNLRSYRPYLPAALFERVAVGSEGRRSAAPVSAPGMEGGEATVVFTDIRASTSVWEAAPEAMQKAIPTHNAVVREAVSRFGGYEVKTIGDAFMVAFEGPCAGVDFGLAVQEALLAAEWPAALLEVPICRRAGLWGGLTVRVGVNHGPVVAETNTLTGRVDYFGHTVNVASRLESVCVPGAVAVPGVVWAQVGTACAPAVAGDEVAAELKGVSDAVPVRHVWPAALAGRQHDPLVGRDVPLVAAGGDGDVSSMHSMHSGSISVASSTGRAVRCLSRPDLFKMQEKHATVGVVSLDVVADSTSAHHVSDCLEAVVPLLQQSRGTLVSLLGENLFTGWNLVQPVPVHAENAVQFVRRALRVPLCPCLTAGLASGTVYHGDVGTRSQRFVTVAGPAVAAGLQVWRTACDAGCRFLYTPGEGAVLVGALQAVLQASTLVQKAAACDAPATLYEMRHDQCDNKVSKAQLD